MDLFDKAHEAGSFFRLGVLHPGKVYTEAFMISMSLRGASPKQTLFAGILSVTLV
jgi:hypothetical protein